VTSGSLAGRAREAYPHRVDAAPTWTTSARKALAVTAGTVLLAVGLALLVLPGPGVPLILAGLGILSVHYRWARRLRARIARDVQRLVAWLRRRRAEEAQ
jgi:uncharacterized protein (TIGR02611 family)